MNPHIVQLEPRLLFAGNTPANVLHINAGGPALVDSVGRGFAPDSGFTGGHSAQPSDTDFLNTDDDLLFSTNRAGADFAFAADVAPGNYIVFLEFADPTSTAAGQRVFDISAEGQLIADHYDIVARAGVKTAIAQAAKVSIADGQLNLSFHAETGEALISAIVLVPTDVPPEVVPYSWQNLTDAQRNTQSLANLKWLGNALYSYSSDNKGHFPPDLAIVSYLEAFLDQRVLSADPRTDTQLPRGVLSPVESAGWAAQLDDFIYLGAGKKNNEPGESVLAYENPQRVSGNINVLLLDGHTETWDRALAASRLGFSPDEPAHPPIFTPSAPKDPAIVQSASNLGILRQAILAYANDHKNKMPPALGVLYQTYHVPIEAFINPRSGKQPPPANWTTQQKVDWINANSDYLLLGADKSLYSVTPVWLSENPASFTDGINLLTNDGQINFYEMQWARELMALQMRPAVVNGSLSYERNPVSIDFWFSEDVSASLGSQDLIFTNLNTGETIPSGRFLIEYDWNSHTARFTYDINTYGVLPNGNYRAALAAAGISDASSSHPVAEFSMDFFILASDANRDRRVDGGDLAILAANWDGEGKRFSQGDFNFDGRVDAADLGILFDSWQTTLPALRAPTRSPVRAPSTMADLLL